MLRLEFARVSKSLLEALSKVKGPTSGTTVAGGTISGKTAKTAATAGQSPGAAYDNSLVKSVLACLGVLLRVQDWAVWTSASTRTVLQALLAFAVDHRSRVRKASHLAISSVLRTGEAKGLPHPAGADVIRHVIRVVMVSLCFILSDDNALFSFFSLDFRPTTLAPGRPTNRRNRPSGRSVSSPPLCPTCRQRASRRLARGCCCRSSLSRRNQWSDCTRYGPCTACSPASPPKIVCRPIATPCCSLRSMTCGRQAIPRMCRKCEKQRVLIILSANHSSHHTQSRKRQHLVTLFFMIAFVFFSHAW